MEKQKTKIITVLVLCLFSVSLLLPMANAGVYDQWYSKTQKIDMWKTLFSTQATTYYSFGQTYKGGNMMVFVCGNPSGTPVIFDAEIHGNEDHDERILYFLAQWLLTSNDANAQTAMQKLRIYFIPQVDEVYSRGNADTQRSRYGVNLNRNFATNWKLTSASSDAYSGPSAASEPETKALQSLFASVNPKFYVNLHVGAGPYVAYSRFGDSTLTKQLLSAAATACKSIGASWYSTVLKTDSSDTGLAIDEAATLGCKCAFIIETVSPSIAWKHTSTIYSQLQTVYYPKIKGLLIAMTGLA